MAREDLLGGLSSLATSGTIRQLRREQLVAAPWQPRRYFERAPLLALARSIRAEGVRQNLVVRPHPQQNGLYEIIAGERRYRASDPAIVQQLDLSPEEAARLVGDPPATLPCLVVPLSDPEARRLSAVENLQRENLDRIDETTYCLLLLQDVLGYQAAPQVTLSQIAQEIGRRLHAFRNHPEQFAQERAAVQTLFDQLGTQEWTSYATNQLPLLQLPDDLLEAVRQGRIAGRSALLIARQTDAALKTELTQKALAGAPFKALTTLIQAQQGKAWRVTAHQVRAALGVRQLEKLPPDKQKRVIALLEQLQQELQ